MRDDLTTLDHDGQDIDGDDCDIGAEPLTDGELQSLMASSTRIWRMTMNDLTTLARALVALGRVQS